ncbi:MAG TPA: SpoVR family protein, partial [Steroidobacteraceae bacterium]
ADFLSQQSYVDAIKCHSDVVRPLASGEQVALTINPYHLGFSLWEEIIKEEGLDAARAILQQDDDFSFVRNQLTLERAEKLQLFRYRAESNGQVKVETPDLGALHEALLHPKYNFGAPTVAAKHVRTDGTLELEHDHHTDGRGLDVERGKKVIEYMQRVWRRPVIMHTIDEHGAEMEFTVPMAPAA